MGEEPLNNSETYEEVEITWFMHRGYVVYKDEKSGRWFIQGWEHHEYLHQDGPIAAIDFEYRTLMSEVCRIEMERSRPNRRG